MVLFSTPGRGSLDPAPAAPKMLARLCKAGPLAAIAETGVGAQQVREGGVAVPKVRLPTE